jgi:4-hydroxybenzoate polyprenyltransferase
LLGVAGLATYTPLKRRWWGGPLWNSWIVALLPLIGFMCGEHAFGISPVLCASMLSVFFSYAIFVLLGYFKDISADRATAYQTFPVVFGWKPAVLLSLLFLAGAMESSAYVMSHLHLNAISMLLWLSGIASLAWAHGKMWLHRDEAQAYHAIGWVVRGYTLLHLAEVTAFRPDLVWFALAFYGVFELVLAYRPERTQI